MTRPQCNETLIYPLFLSFVMALGVGSYPPSLSAQASAVSVGHTVRIPSAVMAGQILKQVQPEPVGNVRGAVVLHVIVAPDGKVIQATTISGPAALREPAVGAVRQWSYKPYLLDGLPVTVDTTVTVNFHP